MLIFIAILVWILINYFTWWLEFYSTLCIVSGIFIIMPTLLKFKFSDLKLIIDNKLIVFINLLFNFIILPIIFVWTGYLLWLHDELLYGLLLLSILPWWGLLMSWVLKTKWNLKLSFTLFLLNLIVFSILFFPVNNYFEQKWNEIVGSNNIIETNKDYFWSLNKKSTWCIVSNIAPNTISCFTDNWGVSPITALLVLIFIPFVLSRFILLSSWLTNAIQSRIRFISSVSTFFIIWYIFSLEQINSIFLVNSNMLFNVWVVLLISYIISYIFWYIFYNIFWKTEDSNALFWNLSIRFITLGLIFSFIYSTVFWIWFTVIFVLAYFIQIILSNIFWRILWK